MRESSNGNGHLRPEDFPLGSPESRAAARLRLKEMEAPPEYHNWPLVGALPQDADPRIPWFGPWESVPDESKLIGTLFKKGDFQRRVYSPPAAWRVLQVGDTNVYDVPCCPACGTALVESGRYGILVRFEVNCADRHDPAPPPPKPPRTPTPEEERFMGQAHEIARDFLTDHGAWDIEEHLAWRLGIHRAYVADYISGRQEASADLRRQIASLVKNLPHPLRPPSVSLKPGEPIPTCPACGASFGKEWDPPFKTEMTYYAPVCYCSVLYPEMATR